MKSHLLIPTAGRPDLLARLLESLSACELPRTLASIVVVENGDPRGAEDACERFRGRVPLRYLWRSQPCKSAALNAGIEGIGDGDLVIMTDDDVRFESQTIEAYHREASATGAGWFFGGPFLADFESTPPDWLLAYLPPSAKGWTPRPERFDPSRDRFFGCNWAAWAGDLRAIGGFDLRFGPGSVASATGQETEAQRRLQSAGLRARLIEDARVWHWVPESRCSPEWALERARRSGVARGIRVASGDSRSPAASHVLNALRLSRATAESVLLWGSDGNRAFDAEYRRRKAAGYFEGCFVPETTARPAA